eukprot:maker-scaffold_14-snap-gene-2.53-mRNA-1 protein AED:0.01 eAED:0.01 QI:95/1/1/1/1/1/3/831/448
MKRANQLKLSKINANTNVDDVAPQLLREMRSKQRQEKFLVDALDKLGVLGKAETAKGSSQAGKLFNHGAASVILFTMANHPENLPIQEGCCTALHNLSGNTITLMKMGVGLKVLEAMEAFPRSMLIQTHGCYVLRNLAVSRPNSEVLLSLGAGNAVLQAMVNHSTSAFVQTAATGTVWSFCITEDNKEALWRLGMAHRVLQAMRQHPKEAKLQEFGCGALCNFGYMYCLMRLGAYEVLFKALHNHRDKPKIAEYACGAIKQLASLETNAGWLMDERAAEEVVRCMESNARHMRVQENGLLAIWSLGLWEGNKDKLMEQRVGDALKRVLLENIKEARLVETACGVVTNLATQEPNAKRLLQLGLHEVLVKIAFHHEDNEQVQSKLTRALRNFAWWGPIFVNALIKANSETVIVKAAKRFKHNQTIVNKCQETLNKFDDFRHQQGMHTSY